MLPPPQLAIAVALLAIATSSYGASCVFEDWQDPPYPPDGIVVINQCQYDDEPIMWLNEPVDIVQYFTSPIDGRATGLGFLILTPKMVTFTILVWWCCKIGLSEFTISCCESVAFLFNRTVCSFTFSYVWHVVMFEKV